jgi:hypothetical protein
VDVDAAAAKDKRGDASENDCNHGKIRGQVNMCQPYVTKEAFAS